MKKEYSQYIKLKLKKIMEKEFPDFIFLDDQKMYGLHYNFVCKDSDNFKMISIQNSHDENAFMVELFWSDNGTKFQSDLTHFWFEDDENVLEKICSESKNSLRVRLPIFYTRDFEAWWAIDPTGKIITSIERYGFITSDAYFQFYSEDTFLSDDINIHKDEYKKYIDPLIDNATTLIRKYAIPLFACHDSKIT